MPRKSFKDALLTVGLGFLPLFAYWVFKEFIEPRPFWAFYDHIESLYYYTGMELAEGDPIHNVDNPGTLVQIVGALVLFFLGTEPADYPSFVFIAHCSILALSFFAATFMVRSCIPNVSVLMGLPVIWTYFLFSVALLFFNVWSPEAFYFIVGAVSIGLFFNFIDDSPSRKSIPAFLFGISIGALISVKFVFLAWLPGLCLTLLIAKPTLAEGLINSAKGLVGAVIGFIVVTLPVRDQYPYMFGWIVQIASRDGDYGSGGIAAPSLSSAWETWVNFALSSKTWIALVVLMMAYLFFFAIKRKNSPKDIEQIKLAFAFVLPSILFSLLFVVRAYQQRYMLPIGLCGVVICILFVRCYRPSNVVIECVVVSAFFVLLIKSIGIDLNTHRSKIDQQLAFNQRVENRLAELAEQDGVDNPIFIYGWRVPAPSFALRQHARLEKQQVKVDVLYPNIGHYTPWPRGEQKFRPPATANTWDYAVIRQEYIENLPVSDFEVVESMGNHKILKRGS